MKYSNKQVFISIDVLKWLELYITSFWQDYYILFCSVYTLFKVCIYINVFIVIHWDSICAYDVII